MEAIIKSVKMVGMQAAVPIERHSFVENPGIFTQEEVNKVYESTGIHSRRILKKSLCTSDLCIFATKELLNRLDWDPKSIDVLIFVSQGPDYSLPATACLMQSYLGLPQTAACMDLTLGCSGFVYAYWIASQLLHSSNGKRALVLCGDTASRNVGDNALLLFGDAGCATALEYDANWSDSHVVVGTDGTGGQHIAVRVGGGRFPLIPKEVQHLDKNQWAQIIKEVSLNLNGAAIFSFTLKVVPALIQSLLELAQVNMNDVDMCVMHQANKFILEHLRKKIDIPPEKYLIDMKDFGNTSSASIPLAMCNKLGDFFMKTPRKTIMAGFGVGWSWGAIIADVQMQVQPEVIEMPDDVEPLPLKQ